ncbi:hypothetical protein ACHHYP_01746 [Achlya hypogyna]|uniref:protein-tyrosine-phosphatase n=1 Tax=Achlya hypogyna TaxID=1202772 RepID=A0A1V9ZT63_ACHHY|nr:hypothetical protein ACHHYP_01746 [Achlya hypogyna]
MANSIGGADAVSSVDMWRSIDAQQRTHPPVSACPVAAVVDTSRAGRLFVGHADAARDPAALAVTAMVALGTGNLSPLEDVHCVDIVDMEDAFLLEHIEDCLAFLIARLDAGCNVLVHCAYGQSRSAAVVVAFLMHIEKLSFAESYARVQASRPCIYINAGFLRQLEIFGAMGCTLQGDSPAHATYRTMCASQRMRDSHIVALEPAPSILSPAAAKCYCRKCNLLLCTTNNTVHRDVATLDA